MHTPTSSNAASASPRELKRALAALGLRCIAGLGASALGPLRLVNTPDVRLEVKRQQMYSAHVITAHVELYVAEQLAERLVCAVLHEARRHGRHGRGSWLLLTGDDLEVIVRDELAALALQARPLTAAERHAAAEAWLKKQWGLADKKWTDL